MFIDYYELLGVNKTANSEEITSAFRREIMKYHPDRNMGNGNPERTRLLIEAKLILLDTEARAKYDNEYQQYKTFVNYSQTPTQEYEIHDEQLEKWIENAKKQATLVYKEIIDEFKQSAKASFKGLKQSAVGCFIAFILILIFKMCNGCSQSNSEKPITLTQQIDETISPASIPVDTFENENLYKVYMIEDVGYISIPNNMELQSGNYKEGMENELKKQARKHHFFIADDRVVFQQEGLNDFSSQGVSLYARIIIETTFGYFDDYLKQTDDYSCTPKELSDLNTMYKQEIIENAKRTGLEIVEWKGISIVKINNGTAIKVSYIRRLDYNPNVCVEMYQFHNNDRQHLITMSYRQQDSTIWKPLFSKVISSFNLTNIK